MRFAAVASLCYLSIAGAYDVLQLTAENYDELTDGKTVFLKFFAPWCGHCKKMAPDWEKLAEEWKDNAVGLVAEIDCTTDGKSLCDTNGIRGFPSLKYGDPSNLEDYQGQRTYDAFAKFAKDNLKPVCSPSNIDLCDADKKTQIEEYMKLSSEDLESKITTEENKLTDAETSFGEAVKKLQEQYQALSEAKEKAIAEVKDSGLGLLKAVKAFLAKKVDTKAKEMDAKEEL